MKKFKVAVIGCGAIANAQHLPALAANKDVEITYVIDLIKERAEKAKNDFGALHADTDYKVALNDKEVEAVFVLTPNFSHATISIDSLNSGKHVFCEKPITINAELSQKMAETAEKNNKILHIGVCNRYNKTVEIIKKYIEDGVLGDVYHVFCSFRSYRSIPGLGGYFTTKSQSGGGVLIDWGVHFIDLILYALGMPKVKTVSADCYNKLGSNIKDYVYTNMWAGPPVLDGTCDVEEFVSSHVRTEKASLTLIGAWAQNIGQDEMFIDFLGDKAGIRMDYFGTFTLYTAKDGILYTENPIYEKSNMYDREQKDFLNSIRTGETTRGNVKYILETAKVMDSIYKSSEEKREIVL